MLHRVRVVTWNGKDVPPELRDLPAGRYVVEAIEDEAPVLSSEESLRTEQDTAVLGRVNTSRALLAAYAVLTRPARAR